MFGEHVFEDTQDTENLVLVAFLSTGDLLRVEEVEPGRLTVVRALAGGLEEEPLEQLVLVFGRGNCDLVRRVVFIDEVNDNRVGLPALFFHQLKRSGRY